MRESKIQNSSVKLLEKLIKQKTKREFRSLELLKDPNDNITNRWKFIVPSCFNRALDIAMTERIENKESILTWTQESAFAFDIGDVIYFNLDVSDLKLNHCEDHYIQIQNASSATPSNRNKKRDHGYVYFWETIYNIEERKILSRKNLTMSQDDFVRYLIIGE